MSFSDRRKCILATNYFWWQNWFVSSSLLTHFSKLFFFSIQNKKKKNNIKVDIVLKDMEDHHFDIVMILEVQMENLIKLSHLAYNVFLFLFLYFSWIKKKKKSKSNLFYKTQKKNSPRPSFKSESDSQIRFSDNNMGNTSKSRIL